MEPRRPAQGYCENIPSILNEPWWPGKLIYKPHTYDDDGVERTAIRALCPACGGWVTARGDKGIVNHRLPAKSQAELDRRRDRARDEYGELRVAEHLRGQAVA
jgi:hypothetical protein